MKRWFLSSILLIFCLMLLAACGSTSSTSAAAPVAPTAPAIPAGDTAVQITLQNIRIHSSITTFKVGVPYYFVITNKDKVAHEFMISPTGMGGHITSYTMTNVTFALVENINPNTIRTLQYTFKTPEPPGSMEFACHYGDHYANGMLLPVVVTK